MDPDHHHLQSAFLGCYDDEDHAGFWDDESSYFEIALEPAPNKHTPNYDHDDDYGDDDDEYRESSDNELQLRISFSSTVPFACPPSSTSTAESCLPENTSSSSDHHEKMPAGKPQKTATTTTIKSRSIHQFPAVNRFLNTILSRPEITTSRRKLGSNISKRMEEGGGVMMKFLVKLRSNNIGALIESLWLRPAQHHQVAAVSSPPKQKRIIIRPVSSTAGSGSNTQRRKSGNKKLALGNSGVWETNLMGGGMKGVNRPSTGMGRSNGSSPVRYPREREMNGGGECWIQAAIAHCKSSYGDVQPSDFQFQTQ